MNFRKKEAAGASGPGSVTAMPILEQAAAPQQGFIKFRGKILIIDDEPLILSIGSKILGMMGNEVLGARSALEGLEMLRKNPDIALILLDMSLPGLEGTEALPLIREISPLAKVVICSGYPASHYGGIPEGADAWLDKPFSTRDAYLAVNTAFGSRL